MILTDGIHLISDASEEELHAFAQGMGLKKRWFQNKPNHPHYDLTTARAKQRAIEQGARLVSGKEIVLTLWRRFQPTRYISFSHGAESSIYEATNIIQDITQMDTRKKTP